MDSRMKNVLESWNSSNEGIFFQLENNDPAAALEIAIDAREEITNFTAEQESIEDVSDTVTPEVVKNALGFFDWYIPECHFIGAGWGSCIERGANRCPNCQAREALSVITHHIDELKSTFQEVIDDYRRLTKELDDALNGYDAAKAPSLCDIVAQVKNNKYKVIKE